jgi:hypothetical protein
MCSLYKKRVRTRYVELVFLHPVRCVGHVVHSSASEAQNIDVIFHARVGPVWISQKTHWDILGRTCDICIHWHPRVT